MLLSSSTCYLLWEYFKSHIAIVDFYRVSNCFSTKSATFTLVLSSCHIWKPNSILIFILFSIKLIRHCRRRHRIIPIFNSTIIRILIIRNIIWIIVFFKLLFTWKTTSCIAISAEVCGIFWLVVFVVEVVVVFVVLVVGSVVIRGNVIVVLVVIVIVVIVVVVLWLLTIAIVISIVVVLTSFHCFLAYLILSIEFHAN